ncbi:class I SAM-dependent methyltransferase [Antribacter gilvus]|uniref:class I SAM-dependent methyltransferase n=1 Tax=Antribacter gilvus TaxID=2304675 RepID=UPI000F78B4D0|nr:class I SAM-dependent methyltransferase [Antribacter gilvus]
MPLAPLAPNAWLRWDVVRGVLPKERVSLLEVGCGQGAFGSRLATMYDYTGVEPDPVAHAAAVAAVGAAGNTGRVVNGDVSSLGAGRTFDVVCAFEVLEHIEDDEKALAQWVERVRPGGLVVLSTPAWQSRFGPWDSAVGHFRRYDPDVMRERLRGAGLVDVGVRCFGAPLGFVLEAARDRLASHRTELREEKPIEARTARSGRLYQPSSGLQGALTQVGTFPFRLVQRAFPGRGTGLVAWGRRALPD